MNIVESVPDARPPISQRKFHSTAIENQLKKVSSLLKDKELAQIFTNAFPNTLDTTVEKAGPNPSAFVITGDIDAMWLRDSTNQVKGYIAFAAQDKKLHEFLVSLVERQASCVDIDPWANAFYPDATRVSPWQTDVTKFLSFANTHTQAMTNHLHERKFEVDSILSFFQLSTMVYNATKDASINTPTFQRAIRKALDVLHTQQTSDTHSQQGVNKAAYLFERDTPRPSDSLQDGIGWPRKRTGMLASGFRPSDDACVYPYNIAQNAMAVVELRNLAKTLNLFGMNNEAQESMTLANEIDNAIKQYGIVTHPITQQRVYAYEVDGYGNQLFMDDAGLPSLLSLPVLGYVSYHDPIYKSTRDYILNPSTNPFYFGTIKNGGIGSPHTGFNRIWPMAIISRALTTNEDNEILECIEMLKQSALKTGLIHESIYLTDFNNFTRAWFAWVNSYFGEMILTLLKTKPHLLT